MIRRSLLFFVLITSSIARADDFPRELVNWKPIAANPVFKGEWGNAWDQKIRERGFVLFDNGQYHLWYTGYNDEKSKLRLLGHATSPDGLAWTRDPANPIVGDHWVEDVFVMKHDGSFVMVAEGEKDVAHQLISKDGVHWTELGKLDVRLADGRPIPDGPYGTPSLWFEDGVWYLFYERGDRGVWLAVSLDRKVWTNVQDTPVLAMGPERYDSEAVAVNQIIKRDGFYYAFYHANATRPWKDWTSNIARSKDLIHWEKYSGNPLVENNCSSPILVSGPGGERLFTMHPDVKVYESVKTADPKAKCP